jgi:rhamnosyltransferase
MPYLRSALWMLKRQTFKDFELFAVDSGSVDSSVEELQRYCDEEHLIRIAPDEYVPGPVLNDAVSRTDADIIVLLNGDAIPRADTWLANLVRPVIEEEADAAYSRQVARPDAHFIVRYDYERAYAPGKKDDHFFSAAACAFRRELWERHQFQNEGYAEDAVWAATCRNFNSRFVMASDSEVEHSHNYTLKELYRKRYRHGCSFARILGETSSLRHRIYLCGRELVRDLVYAVRRLQITAVPYNIAYRITIHAGLYMGVREGSR